MKGAWAQVREQIGYRTPETAPPPSSRRLLARARGRPVARLSLGVSKELVGTPGRTGYVGWYEAVDPDAGTALLCRAREILSEDGIRRVIGPFHGSTWDRYRLAVRAPGPEEPPPFLTEPWNPPDYPAHFAAAGFEPVAEYESRVAAPAEAAALERGAEARARLGEGGISVRTLNPARFNEELRRIHDLSVDAFAANRFYAPIGWTRFHALYAPLRTLLDPSLVLLAESAAGEPLGFCFSLVDTLAPPERPRVIVKTLASAPAARGMGLAGALVSITHASEAARGAEIVHALIESGNLSRRISAGHEARPFRRYALFAATSS